VVDEIQMGFYRTGKLWAIEHFGVVPDVLVFGKALTNGLNPLSGLWAREELINPRSSRRARRIRPSPPIRSAPRSASRP
jgi:4-aminobutyrate aminotransferase/(S)-3-amino-2-methylpropionate transaminase